MNRIKPRTRRILREIIAHPHDGIVKYAFSKRVHAIGLLKAILPQAIARAIQWRTVKLAKESFIDPSLRKRYADLLFTMRIGGADVRVYVLLEHQRGVEKLMMLRILGYLARIWEHMARSDPGRDTLPPIVPILLHNGEEGWTAETSFQRIIAFPDRARDDLARHTPAFEARLIQLSAERATPLATELLTAFARLVLWALGIAGNNQRFVDEINRMQDAIDEAYAAPDGYEALAVLLAYISATHERVSSKRFEQALEKAARRDKTIMATVAEEWLAEGRIEGRVEGRTDGRVEGRATTLLDLLAVKFGPVPAAAKKRVLAADEPTLQRWSRRVLSETSIASVLDDGRPTAPRKRARGRRAA